MKALSIVSPNGTRIARGFKTIEVRSWQPAIDLNADFLIVENDQYLKEENSVDQNGKIVAIAQIDLIREFVPGDIPSACANYWADGYYSWELKNIRPVIYPLNVEARLALYELELDTAKLVFLEIKKMAKVIEDYEIAYPNPIQLFIDDLVSIEKV